MWTLRKQNRASHHRVSPSRRGEHQTCSRGSLQLKSSLLSDATSKKGKVKVSRMSKRARCSLGLLSAASHGLIESHSVSRSMNQQFRELAGTCRNLVTPRQYLESFMLVSISMEDSSRTACCCCAITSHQRHRTITSPSFLLGLPNDAKHFRYTISANLGDISSSSMMDHDKHVQVRGSLTQLSMWPVQKGHASPKNR